MKPAGSVWVVDDDQSIRWVLEKALQKSGFEVRTFESAGALLQALEEEAPGVVITDIRMPGMDGIALLDRLQRQVPGLPVIVITAHSDLDSAVKAYNEGAFDYLPKPFDVHEMVELVRRAVARVPDEIDNETVAGEASRLGIIGQAPAMQEVFRTIGRLSRSNISVLITGESGTGKELVARALHQHSPRAGRPFVALNMAAIPRELMEAELFGHEKGAFTGAQSRRVGRFEQAEGGTLFLDEIGDMPFEAQTRLLRVLADGEFYPVGGVEPVRADVRILAATHQDLERLVEAGKFREDLYHRLNVIRIRIPPLRERREDIPLLMDYHLRRAAEELEAEQKVLTGEALALLQEFHWPGNVRQLENLARWLTVMAAGREVKARDLPPEFQQGQEHGGSRAPSGDWRQLLEIWVRERYLQGDTGLEQEVERALIQAALAATGGRKQEAARLLGWGRNTLTRKLKEMEG